MTQAATALDLLKLVLERHPDGAPDPATTLALYRQCLSAVSTDPLPSETTAMNIRLTCPSCGEAIDVTVPLPDQDQ